MRLEPHLEAHNAIKTTVEEFGIVATSCHINTSWEFENCIGSSAPRGFMVLSLLYILVHISYSTPFHADPSIPITRGKMAIFIYHEIVSGATVSIYIGQAR
jgi:hypothetical protein